MSRRLLSPSHSAIVHAKVTAGHVQLRNLITCPRKRGVIYYINERGIVEKNLSDPEVPGHTIAELGFDPVAVSLASLPIGTDDILFAAGGLDAELNLSYYSPSSSSDEPSTPLWQLNTRLAGTINNSVFLTSLNLGTSNESSAEPRAVVSNNDCTVRLYDIPLRAQWTGGEIKETGVLDFDVPMNHSSISPDGRILLSVGDSDKAYLHSITGGERVTFSHTATLPLPPPDAIPLVYPLSTFSASFSTAFSTDGMKFAIASQEGVVSVWDVRNMKPLKIFQTDKTRGSTGIGGDTAWRHGDNQFDWMAPPEWCPRNVKFGRQMNTGKEIMVFTEHQSLLHVVDAGTFETEEVYCVPTLLRTHLEYTVPETSLTQSSTQSMIFPSGPTSPQFSSNPAAVVENAMEVDISIDTDDTTDADVVYDYFSDESDIDNAPSVESPTTSLSVYSNAVQTARWNDTVIYEDCSSITGVCFDPTGGWLYVGSRDTIVEWEVLSASA